MWEGSDDWVRSQFYIYILALLAVAKSDNTEAASEFNDEFINAWKTKHNYRVWSCTEHPGMGDIQATHPFSGQLNVNDVLLRMGNSLNSSEQGKKMISTISNTGRYVAETGSRFKSSISSWVRNTTSRFQDNQKNENSKS